MGASLGQPRASLLPIEDGDPGSGFQLLNPLRYGGLRGVGLAAARSNVPSSAIQ
jgi:hypothetical protein